MHGAFLALRARASQPCSVDDLSPGESAGAFLKEIALKLVKMIRTVPEIPGGPLACDIQPVDLPLLRARGWVQDGEEYDTEGQKAASAPALDSEEKKALIEKAMQLKETHPKAVKAAPSAIPNMSIEKLTSLIEEAEAIINKQDQE